MTGVGKKQTVSLFLDSLNCSATRNRTPVQKERQLESLILSLWYSVPSMAKIPTTHTHT